MQDNLVYICTECGLCLHRTAADAGCSNCSSRLFRVASATQPYGQLPYRTTPKDPYNRDPEEDGYQFTTPMGEGDMSNAALGNGANSGSVGLLHEPGDPFDRNTTGGNSDNLMYEDEPLNKMRQKEQSPKHIGPFNMPHPSFNALRDQNDLFERVRKRRKQR